MSDLSMPMMLTPAGAAAYTKKNLMAAARAAGWRGDSARTKGAEFAEFLFGGAVVQVEQPAPPAPPAPVTVKADPPAPPPSPEPDTLQKFRDAMRAAGLIPPKHIKADGRIHRCGTEGKAGDQDGAYVLHSKPYPHGGFQNHRDDAGWIRFATDDLPPEILAAFQSQVVEHAKAEAAERQARQQDTAKVAITIWENAKPASSDHPYLVKKHIKPNGLRQDDQGNLIVPLKNPSNGDIDSIQTIGPDGRKSFLAGGRKQGNFWQIYDGDDLPKMDVIAIAEGVATAASVFEATGHYTVIAFDAGNLLSVASTMRQRLPKARIIIAADDDHQTEGNPGMSKAKEAAIAVNGLLAVPWPDGSPPAGQTDFNDLMVSKGVAAVQEAIKAAQYVSNDGPIEAALAAQKQDPGAVFNPKVLAMVRTVRATDPERWARIREAVKQTRNVKMDDFDKLTSPDKAAATNAALFPLDEPWEDEVSGAELLDDLVAMIRSFVIADDESIQAAALWIMATHFVAVSKFAPILNITAPEKRCGKSTLLEVAEMLVLRALMTSNISSAALFRVVAAYMPTLLLDEVDTFLAAIPEAKGMLNAGVQPKGRIIRCGGGGDSGDITTEIFPVFGYKALSGIGALAATLTDRSIPVRMRRKFPDEKVAKLRRAKEEEFTVLRRKMVRFSEDRSADFAAIIPANIDTLHDRANDCWEPLLQVAELAGVDWLLRATNAAVSLMSVESVSEGTNIDLLAAVRRAFAVNEVDKISLVALTETLILEEDARWSDYNKGGKPIVKGQISERMKGFVGVTQPVRHPNGTVYKAIGYPTKAVAKGYHLEKFKDTFARYLPPVTDEEKQAWEEVAKGYFPGGCPKSAI